MGRFRLNRYLNSIIIAVIAEHSSMASPRPTPIKTVTRTRKSHTFWYSPAAIESTHSPQFVASCWPSPLACLRIHSLAVITSSFSPGSSFGIPDASSLLRTALSSGRTK